ncbi:MAG TPA: hypothetical protein VH298_00200, partial [Jatrophihabitans sp.]|nr:hypothetical protein [Jatrophihabitans sp.]
MATNQPSRRRTTSALRSPSPVVSATLPIGTSDSRTWTGPLIVDDSAPSAFDPTSTVQRLVSVLGNNT